MKEKYIVQFGFEHPGTGHWVEAGSEVELSERQAKILRLNGHIKPASSAENKTAKKSKK